MEDAIVGGRVEITRGGGELAWRTPGGSGANRSTGIAEVDAVIEAVEAGDIDAVGGLLQYQPVACAKQPSGIPSPPACPESQPEGTPVDVVMGAACEGFYVTREEAPEWLRGQFSGALELFAVYNIESHIGLEADYDALFVNPDAPVEGVGVEVAIAGRRIVAITSTCVTVESALNRLADQGAQAILPPAR